MSPAKKNQMDQKETPLFSAVVEYAKRNKISFHTPGHKHGFAMPKMFREFVGERIFDMDLTLLAEVDSLHEPTGVIKKAQALAAQAYGADQSFFLVNGTSGGNQAMLLSTCRPGDTVLIPRNCHRSVMAGVLLVGCKPEFIEPEWRETMPLNLSVESVDRALRRHPDAKAVMVTHPTYHGVGADLKAIAALVHQRDLPLLVDSAHGPHLRFHPDLPVSAMDAGADMAVESMHKILSGMTQASMLHVRKKRVDLGRLKTVLQSLTSTSPSYILMCSLDVARMQMATEGKNLLQLALDLARRARSQINAIEGLHCFGKELEERPGCEIIDETKLVVAVTGLGLTGYEVSSMLNNEWNIQVEYADPFSILLMVSIGNRDKEIDKLIRALKSIAKNKVRPVAQRGFDSHWLAPLAMPEAVMSPREAFFAKTEKIKFGKSAGRVSAELVAPYPPGVPWIVPGERISLECLTRLRQIQKAGGIIQGQEDPGVKTLKVVVEE